MKVKKKMKIYDLIIKSNKSMATVYRAIKKLGIKPKITEHEYSEADSLRILEKIKNHGNKKQ